MSDTLFLEEYMLTCTYSAVCPDNMAPLTPLALEPEYSRAYRILEISDIVSCSVGRFPAEKGVKESPGSTIHRLSGFIHPHTEIQPEDRYMGKGFSIPKY